MELILGILALALSSVSIVVSVVRFRRSEHNAKADAAARDAWTLEQIARWRRGELKAQQEPSIIGDGDVLVIEPTPGERIVVGTVRNGVQRSATN